MYKRAQTAQCRPSDLLAIRNRWLAYDFDVAVMRFGDWAKNRMEERDKKFKYVRTPEEALGIYVERKQEPIDPNMLGIMMMPFAGTTRKPGRIKRPETENIH